MHRTLHTLLALSFATSLLPAQSYAAVRISPRGAEFFEGNSGSDIMLGNWAAQTRTQQIDNNLVNQPMPLIRFIGWRRDGNANAGAAKATNLTIYMAHADFNMITNTWATNYKGSPTTVFAKKSVNLPDWNPAAPSVPSPFDLIVPLDAPFVYNATDALLYDVLNENNPLGKYQEDWVSSMTHAYGDYPRGLGGGCQTANGAFTQRCAFRANATVLELGFDVNGAPGAASVTMLLGVNDPNANLPGLCGTIHTLPLVSFVLGTATANGDIPLAYPISTPWAAAYAGAVLYTQALAADPSQPGLPVVLSNGLRVAAPASNATGTAPIGVKRIYHTSSVTSATGTGPSVSAVPTFFAY